MRKEKNPVWTPVFLSVFFLSFLTSAGFYMTMPTLPKYAVSVGMTLTDAGKLVGIFSIVAIIARPAGGFLSDHVNKKWLVTAAYLGMGISSLGYSLSSSAPALYVCRIFHGLFFAVSSTVQLAFAAEIVPKERIGEGLSYMGMAQILASSFAPSLGLQLVAWIGYTGMFRLSGAVILLSGGLMTFLPYRPESPGIISNKNKSIRLGMFIHADLLLLAVIGGLFSFVNSIASSYLSMLGDERNIAGISVFFTVASVSVIAVRPVIGRLNDRCGMLPVLIPSMIFCAAGMFLIGGAWGRIPVLAAAVLKGVSQSSGQVSVQAECVRRKRPEERGTAVATCYLGNDLGNSFGAGCGGWYAEKYGFGNMFSASGVLMLGGLALLALQLMIDRCSKEGKKCR